MASERTFGLLAEPDIQLAHSSTEKEEGRYVGSFREESALGPDDVKSRDDDDGVDPSNGVEQD